MGRDKADSAGNMRHIAKESNAVPVHDRGFRRAITLRCWLWGASMRRSTRPSTWCVAALRFMVALSRTNLFLTSMAGAICRTLAHYLSDCVADRSAVSLPSRNDLLTHPCRDFHPTNHAPSRAHQERSPERDL